MAKKPKSTEPKEDIDDFINQMKSAMKVQVAEDGFVSDVKEWADSGCYALNLISGGSIFRGLPCGRAICFAGDPATGKTYFTLNVLGGLQESLGKTLIYYTDTENAIESNMPEDHGIPPKYFLLEDEATIESFKHDTIKILEAYNKEPRGYRIALALDSLAMLATEAENEKAAKADKTKDMQKPQQVRLMFKQILRRCAEARAPFIITSQVYKNTSGKGPDEAINGGGGLTYSASAILWLSKAQDTNKDTKERLGSFITVRAHKSRFVREGQWVKVKLNHTSGLNKYWGLVELAVRYKVITIDAKGRVTWPGRGDTKYFPKTIYDKPEEFFTQEILEQFDEAFKPFFIYGGNGNLGEDGLGVEGDPDDPDSDTNLLLESVEE